MKRFVCWMGSLPFNSVSPFLSLLDFRNFKVTITSHTNVNGLRIGHLTNFVSQTEIFFRYDRQGHTEVLCERGSGGFHRSKESVSTFIIKKKK